MTDKLRVAMAGVQMSDEGDGDGDGKCKVDGEFFSTLPSVLGSVVFGPFIGILAPRRHYNPHQRICWHYSTFIFLKY